MSTIRVVAKTATAQLIKRALKACDDAGFTPQSVRLDPYGEILVSFNNDTKAENTKLNEWDEGNFTNG